MPKETNKRLIRMSWSTVSKAALTSNRARSVTSALSMAPYKSESRRSKRDSVEWFFLNLTEQVIGIYMQCYLTGYNFLNDFRNKCYIKYKPVVDHVGWIKSLMLQGRKKYGALWKTGRTPSSSERLQRSARNGR